jgi:hypothetical protein
VTVESKPEVAALPEEPDDGADTTAAEATLRPLLLHSLSELREIWLPLLELAGIRSATEIGSESGVTSELLIARMHAAGGGRLVIVDPGALEVAAPDDVERTVVRGYSPAALEGLEPTDAYLIDGDHNYWTVSRELATIAAAAQGRATFPLLLLNDVSWPAARRDQYYAPDRLPPEAVRPHSFELGAVPGEARLQASGFRGEGSFAYAFDEGGPRNGVLTAVEDFLAERPDLELHLVAPVFGLGVVIDKAAPWADAVRAALAPYAGSAFLARLERNRTDLFVRLIELQDLVKVQEQQLGDGLAAAIRGRRADQVVHEAELAAAAEQEFALREQLAAAEVDLHRVRAELQQIRAERDAARSDAARATRPDGGLPGALRALRRAGRRLRR